MFLLAIRFCFKIKPVLFSQSARFVNIFGFWIVKIIRNFDDLVMSENLENKDLKLAVLPLKNVVTLPRRVTPVRVGRQFSLNAVDYALKESGEVFVTAQKDSNVEKPGIDDIYQIGVKSRILQSSNEKDGSVKLLVEGIKRAKIVSYHDLDDFMVASVEEIDSIPVKDENNEKALVRQIHTLFKEYSAFEDRLSTEIYNLVKEIKDLDSLVDAVAIQMNLDQKVSQEILELLDLEARAIKICGIISGEIEIIKTERNIRKRVQKQVEKNQKDYYLNEQMRAISRELGREDSAQEVDEFRKKVKSLKLSKEAGDKVLSECKKLELMQPSSPEATVSRNYIDWLLGVPWSKTTKDTVGIDEAAKILDSSHAGMKKPKERILEFIATKKFAGDKLSKSPIICFAGPPGVGKTSLAETIAKSLGRVFIKISLGGLRDEAEIRGHRKTYIGSAAGKIIQAMRKAQVVNPVILLDEIDKISSDFRGDPSSALLEALDPEQNNKFSDHFLEVDYDLSKTMFIATANTTEGIPYPLLDRMEVISLSGYTAEEKLEIAQKFLVPKLLDEHGLVFDQIGLSSEIIKILIEQYTREAGVRQLGQLIAKVLRKSIQILLLEKKKKFVEITKELIAKWLGPEKYRPYKRAGDQQIGVCTGLAWTEVGGDILEVEISIFKGKGALTLTGQLGEVMQESAQAALSYVRSNEKALGIKNNFYTSSDLHIHVPEGSIPKDGPSAGVTIATALVSLLTNRPVDPGVAMTGEITLRGRVLPVGGLKEKILAAIRLGIGTVIVPKENENDIKEFITEIEDKIRVVYAKDIETVLANALKPSTKKHRIASSEKPTKKPKPKDLKKTKKAKA